MNVGLLIARLVFGPLLEAHGCQKLFGWFGSSGMSGTATFFESLGFLPGPIVRRRDGSRPMWRRAPPRARLYSACRGGADHLVMIVAIATVHWGNVLLSPKGIELPLLYLTTAISLALTGPGAHSLDALLGLTPWWTPQMTAIVLGTGVVGGFVTLGIRRCAPAVAHA